MISRITPIIPITLIIPITQKTPSSLVTFQFSVLIPLRGLFLLVARHNQNNFCFCSRLLAVFRLFIPYRPFFIVRPKSKIRFTVPPQQFATLGPYPGMYHGSPNS